MHPSSPVATMVTRGTAAASIAVATQEKGEEKEKEGRREKRTEDVPCVTVATMVTRATVATSIAIATRAVIARGTIAIAPITTVASISTVSLMHILAKRQEIRRGRRKNQNSCTRIIRQK